MSHKFSKTLRELKVRSNVGEPEESVRSYNLDDADSSRRAQTILSDSLPSRETANSIVEIYFSTIHVAYPFLSRETFDSLFPRLWEESPQSLSDAWKATFCTSPAYPRSYLVDIMFAWGAAYASMSGESEGSDDAHINYYNQARLYLGDVIDIFPPRIDVISCLLLVSLYLLMTHKPYRYAAQSNQFMF